jgi:hypothetical protein
MPRNFFPYSISLLGGLIVLSLALYQPLIRPWHLSWGASPAELQAVLPGDDLVNGDLTQSTRAISVQTAPDKIWPWLLQMGQGRGGLYSYDFLENLAGCDIHTLNMIVPEYQNLKIGDNIKLGPQDGLPYYRVVQLEAQQALVLRSVNPKTGESGETWGFYLRAIQLNQTRLIIRHRSPNSQKFPDQFINAIFEPIAFVMEQRMLVGLREHTEK